MIYYCPACHYIYPASTARDTAFCPDCGTAMPRPATEEQREQYEKDRASIALHLLDNRHRIEMDF